MTKLDQQLQEISESIKAHEIIDERVSMSSVGWHIDHVLLSINGIIAALQRSNPSDYRWTFNLRRLVVFTIGRIPRGSAKSPKSVLPKDFSYASLIQHIETTRQNVKIINDLPKDSYFVHPYFGSLRLNNARKFIKIHTQHHLKIIRDILKHHHSNSIQKK